MPSHLPYPLPQTAAIEISITTGDNRVHMVDRDLPSDNIKLVLHSNLPENITGHPKAYFTRIRDKKCWSKCPPRCLQY